MSGMFARFYQLHAVTFAAGILLGLSVAGSVWLVWPKPVKPAREMQQRASDAVRAAGEIAKAEREKAAQRYGLELEKRDKLLEQLFQMLESNEDKKQEFGVFLQLLRQQYEKES